MGSPDQLVRYLILQTGGSMSMAGELSKLICYSDQPVLTPGGSDAVVIPVLEAAIFDITRDIGTRNFDNALQKDLSGHRAHCDSGFIGRQIRQMYAAKVLSEHGKDAYALMQLYGIRDCQGGLPSGPAIRRSGFGHHAEGGLCHENLLRR